MQSIHAEHTYSACCFACVTATMKSKTTMHKHTHLLISLPRLTSFLNTEVLVIAGSQHSLDRSNNRICNCGLHGILWGHDSVSGRPHRVFTEQHVCWHCSHQLWCLLDWLRMVFNNCSWGNHPCNWSQRLGVHLLPSRISQCWLLHVRLPTTL